MIAPNAVILCMNYCIESGGCVYCQARNILAVIGADPDI